MLSWFPQALSRDLIWNTFQEKSWQGYLSLFHFCWLLAQENLSIFLEKAKVYIYIYIGRLSRWLSVNNLSATAGDTGSILGLGKSPGERKWQPTPVFLPGKTHGQRSLAGYSSWDHKRVRHDLATKQQQHMGRQRHSPKTILYRSSKVLLSPVW